MTAATQNVKIPGREPVFRHLGDDDVPWQQVKTQRNADGTTSSVWEKWFAFSPDPQYLSLYARYDPGMIVRRHGHFSPHVLFVIEGEVWCGDRAVPRRRRRGDALRGDDGRPALVGRRPRRVRAGTG